MFLSNKYTKCYYQIISNAKTRIQPNDLFENHHIIPKSLGGTNDSHNVVKLTLREHFICHQLLIKMVESKHKSKMAFALWRMCNSKKKYYKITSRIYANTKKLAKIALSNRIVTDDTRLKQSKSKKITHNTPEFKHNASLRALNRSEEHKAKIGLSHRNKVVSKEVKQILSEKLSGDKNPRALSWTIFFEDCSPTIQINSLKTWCYDNNLKYCSVYKTFKTKKFYKGVKVSK